MPLPKEIDLSGLNVDTSYKSICSPTIGESSLDTHKRVLPVVKELEKKLLNGEGDILIITHAITTVSLVRGFMRDPSLDVKVGTCSISAINYHSDQKQILKLGFVDHLPGKGQSVFSLKPNSEDQKTINELLPTFFETI